MLSARRDGRSSNLMSAARRFGPRDHGAGAASTCREALGRDRAAIGDREIDVMSNGTGYGMRHLGIDACRALGRRETIQKARSRRRP
jgi:hypothetical protein